jgi:hypothetical protein
MTTSTEVYGYTYFSALKHVAKKAILYLGAPYLFLSFLAFLFAATHMPSYARAYSGSVFACILSLVGFTCIFLLTLRTYSFNKRNYQTLRAQLTLEDRFEPQMELHNASYSQYLGLDTKNGTLVCFGTVNSKERLMARDMLVVGFTSTSWRKCELLGSRLTIYTNDPMIPHISFRHRLAPLVYERLCAMQRIDYTHDVNFPGWVEHKATAATQSLNLNLISVRY